MNYKYSSGYWERLAADLCWDYETHDDDYVIFKRDGKEICLETEAAVDIQRAIIDAWLEAD